MRNLKTFGVLSTMLIATIGFADSIDFLHMPRHTVELPLSTLSGHPRSARLDGYYLYRDGDRIVFLSHRPDRYGNRFTATATLDDGSFRGLDVINRNQRDWLDGRGPHLRWDLETRWNRLNGIAFAPRSAHYLVFDIRDDIHAAPLPAIFVGGHEERYKTGSGYILIDLLK